MTGIHIRRAQLSDAAELLPLIEAYWRHDAIGGFEASRLLRQLQELLATPGFGQCWVATHGEQPVGYLLASFVYSFEHGGITAEVDEFFVSESHRGQGLGGRLFDAACEGLKAHGCRSVQLEVASGNRDAQRFYAAKGFTERRGFSLWVVPLKRG